MSWPAGDFIAVSSSGEKGEESRQSCNSGSSWSSKLLGVEMFCPATLWHNGVGALNEAAVQHSHCTARHCARHAHLGLQLELPALSQPHAHGCDKWHGHRKGFTPLLSFLSPTAFWGESDDSSSELEAALRPQTHGTDSDDFDDFYD